MGLGYLSGRTNSHSIIKPDGICYSVKTTTENFLEHALHSLVPRPPPFFVLQFSFSIIHGSRGGGIHVQITY